MSGVWFHVCCKYTLPDKKVNSVFLLRSAVTISGREHGKIFAMCGFAE